MLTTLKTLLRWRTSNPKSQIWHHSETILSRNYSEIYKQCWNTEIKPTIFLQKFRNMQANSLLIKKRTSRSKGWYTYDVQENCPIFKTPPSHPPYPSTSKILRPTWPWMSNFNQTPPTLPPPPSPNHNQPIKRKHNPSCYFVALYSCVCRCQLC